MTATPRVTVKISQAEARRLKKRVKELEGVINDQRSSFATDWPGGVNFWTLTIMTETQAAVVTARALNHAIVAVPCGDELRLYALPAAKPL